MGLRPEHLTIGDLNGAEGITINGRAVVVENMGSESYVHVRLATNPHKDSATSGNTVVVRVPSPQLGGQLIKEGEQVPVAINSNNCHVFDRAVQF